MTCIIAHTDGWMLADRRVTWPGGRIGPITASKIHRFINGFGQTTGLVSSAGDNVYHTLTNTLDQVQPWHEINGKIRDIINSNETDGHFIVLTRSDLGHCIYEIGSSGSIVTINSAYWAIGSGYELAMGFLKGLQQERLDCDRITATITPKDAIKALKFVETMSAECGDGWTLEYTDGPDISRNSDMG